MDKIIKREEMMMRYEPIYDENDYIIDNNTGEYLTIEEACNIMNDMYEDIQKIALFYKDFTDMLDKEGNILG